MKYWSYGLFFVLAFMPEVARQRSFGLEYRAGHLFADVQVQDSLPACALLESGIPFPLIDVEFVRRHSASFQLRELGSPICFRMANGINYEAEYEVDPGLKVGDSRSLCKTYVVDLQGLPVELMYPLNCFTTDSVSEPGVFLLDITGRSMDMFPAGQLPTPDEGWEAWPMVRDSCMGMFVVTGSLEFADLEGRSLKNPMEFTVDLGNANLLALFAAKPGVGEFIAQAPVGILQGENSRGVKFRALQPPVVRFMDKYTFTRQTIVLLDRSVRLPGDGFLGTRFFRGLPGDFRFPQRPVVAAIPRSARASEIGEFPVIVARNSFYALKSPEKGQKQGVFGKSLSREAYL